MGKAKTFLDLLAICLVVAGRLATAGTQAISLTSPVLNPLDNRALVTLLPNGQAVMATNAASSRIDCPELSLLSNAAGFGNAGSVRYDFKVNHQASCVWGGQGIVGLSDNKFLVGAIVGREKNYAGVARFHQNGALDASFCGNGACLNFIGNNPIARALASRNGKIVQAGYTTTNGGIRPFVLRMNANGTPDVSFGNNGKKIIELNNSQFIHYGIFAVGIDSANRILYSGYVDEKNTSRTIIVGRLTASGNIDNTFGLAGAKFGYVNLRNSIAGHVGEAWSLEVQTDDSVLIAGLVDGKYGDMESGAPILAKLTSEGRYAHDFGYRGKAEISDVAARFYGVATRADGKIIAVGSAEKDPHGFQPVLARFTSQGVLEALNPISSSYRAMAWSVAARDNTYAYSTFNNQSKRATLTVVKNVLPFAGDRKIAECAANGTGNEACAWRYIYDAKCADSKCPNLVVYFSGGQMSCPDPEASPNSYLGRYSSKGYVAVCAKIFDSSDSSGDFPMNREATRVDLLMKAITSDPAIKQGWSGERLLISGTSHGATAPVIAMARTNLDESASWKGTKVTAACFFDGIYHAKNFMELNSNAKNTNPVGKSCPLYERAYGRYCPWTGNLNIPATWPHPNTCQNEDTVKDTITNVNPSNFAIKHWKLIECGSALDFCSADLVPAAPINYLCNRIAGTAEHSCAFASFPAKSHLMCGADIESMDSCRTWFDGIH